MTKIKQFSQLRAIKNSLKVVAASSLAVGVAAIVPAAPAHAVSFNTGELDFGVFTTSFSSNVNLAPGNNFNVTFNPSGTTNIFRADGSFSPTFTTGTNIGSNSPTVNFSYVSGTTYRLNQDLVLNFGTTTPTSFTLRQNSTFSESDIFSNGLKVGSGLQLTSSTGSFFTNGGDITNVPTLAFSLNDTGLPSGGLYITQASPTSVPEPFTVIGTIVGGTAAFRMRKKLANVNKN
jgi:hypothetical protein